MTFPILLSLLASTWIATGPDWFAPAENGWRPDFRNILFFPDGATRLAREFDSLPAPDASAAWTIVPDGSGGAFLGTGNSGRVFHRTADGRLSQVFEGGPGQVLAMARSRTGVLIGLTPGGDVREIRGGSASLVAATGEDYVFDLLPGPAGEIWIATGSEGRLLRLNPGGSVDTVFSAGQSHLTCLAWLEPGRALLVGTSPEGIVYRLDLPTGAGKPRAVVLYDTPFDEVRRIALSATGDRVFIAANPSDDSDNGPTGTIFCVEPDGIPRWSWECADGLVFDVLSVGPGLLAATGDDGNIYRLDSLGRAALCQRVGQSQVTRLVRDGSMVWVGAATPAGLYRLGTGNAREGYFVAGPFDCASRARFGRFEFRADVPAGTELAFDTRSGDAELPDSTWSDWIPVAGVIQCPTARFVQWRARFASRFPDRSPELFRVDLNYDIPNRAPDITEFSLEAVEPGAAALGQASPVRELTWTAEDPDSDSLGYTVLFRGDSEATWKELAGDITGTSYSLDTRVLADGWYRFRVRASDAPVRPAGSALAAERTSPPVLLDNTPPVVSGLAVGGNRLDFVAADASSNIAGARWSVNAGDWLPVGPADGLLDSPRESFAATIELGPGESVVAVRVADSQGNTTTARIIVRR